MPMWKTILKIAISVLILGVLFHQIHFDELLPYFEKISVTGFVLAIAVQFSASLLVAWRWYLIMCTLEFRVPLSFYVKSYLKGLVFNQVLPTTIGGDAYRMIETAQLGYGKKDAVLGILVDRVYGFAGLVILSLISLPFAYSLLPTNVFYIIFTINIIFIVGLIVLLWLQRISIPFLRTVFDVVRDLSLRVVQSVGSKNSFLIKTILMITPNFLTICVFFILARTLGVNGNLSDFLVIVPSILVLTIIPISLAGWGVREGAMVFLGGLIGIARPEAFAISLLYGFILILNSMPGLYFYLSHIKRKNI